MLHKCLGNRNKLISLFICPVTLCFLSLIKHFSYYWKPLHLKIKEIIFYQFFLLEIVILCHNFSQYLGSTLCVIYMCVCVCVLAHLRIRQVKLCLHCVCGLGVMCTIGGNRHGHVELSLNPGLGCLDFA